jgi:signal transduction histidine kinase
MSECLPADTGILLAAGAEISRGESEQFLLQAFRSFAEAADSLERSYGKLRSEVARLHGELEQSNAGLANSLAENRRMREHLDRILDGLPCGVLVVKGEGAISLVNPEGRRLLGWDEETSRLESLTAVPEEFGDLLKRARSQAGEQELRLEQGNENGDGNGSGNRGERWLAVRHAAVKDADAKEAGGNESQNESENESEKESENSSESAECVSVFILRDVTDAKRLVEERDKLRREQALAEMSAILAHEIRNPLGSLELFAGLLAGAGLSSECRQWVEQVQAGLRTLAATVNNVLHFHSLPKPERVPTDLGALLDWAGGFLVPMARQARVELCLRNHLHGVWFAADRHRLEQVLLNLVLNALRAMPGGGWVEISGQTTYHRERRGVAIAVSDTGPGVPPGSEAKIFEPGFSTRAGGPGLGLAVCRKIVEQHGGSLEARNRAGAGASFRLAFPLEE